MNADFWNNRYKEEEYAYGLEPNAFLKSMRRVFKPDSKILCLAEGEGRNAVFLASKGHRITAVDYAQEGLNKLQKLASYKNLSIETLCVDLTHYKIEEHAWDGIICLFGHFPESLRKAVFTQVYKGLNKGGVFLMEAYRKDQLKCKTGGPQVVELLYSKEELQEDFSAFTAITVETCDKDIEEGKYHKGISAVIQLVAKKTVN